MVNVPFPHCEPNRKLARKEICEFVNYTYVGMVSEMASLKTIYKALVELPFQAQCLTFLFLLGAGFVTVFT